MVFLSHRPPRPQNHRSQAFRSHQSASARTHTPTSANRRQRGSVNTVKLAITVQEGRLQPLHFHVVVNFTLAYQLMNQLINLEFFYLLEL